MRDGIAITMRTFNFHCPIIQLSTVMSSLLLPPFSPSLSLSLTAIGGVNIYGKLNVMHLVRELL